MSLAHRPGGWIARLLDLSVYEDRGPSASVLHVKIRFARYPDVIEAPFGHVIMCMDRAGYPPAGPNVPPHSTDQSVLKQMGWL